MRSPSKGIAVGATPYSSCPSSLPWISAKPRPSLRKGIRQPQFEDRRLPEPASLSSRRAPAKKKFDPAAVVAIDALPTVKGLVAAAKSRPSIRASIGARWMRPLRRSATWLASNDTATLESHHGHLALDLTVGAIQLQRRCQRLRVRAQPSLGGQSQILRARADGAVRFWSTTAARPSASLSQPVMSARRDRQAHEREMEWRRLGRTCPTVRASSSLPASAVASAR